MNLTMTRKEMFVRGLSMVWASIKSIFYKVPIEIIWCDSEEDMLAKGKEILRKE